MTSLEMARARATGRLRTELIELLRAEDDEAAALVWNAIQDLKSLSHQHEEEETTE
jgi:protein-arginine kinase activator protein McsA